MNSTHPNRPHRFNHEACLHKERLLSKQFSEPQMLTENDVVNAVAQFLKLNGFRVERILTTMERGIDIEAVHSPSGQRLLIEAKGGTSSKSTSRFGKPFSLNQAKSHVSVALYYALKLKQKHTKEDARVALAFPDDGKHTVLVDNICDALATLKIEVFFVNDKREVRRFNQVKEPV
jgi:hypothetical protein